MIKNIFLMLSCLICFMWVWFAFRADWLFSYKELIVKEYFEEFRANDYFPYDVEEGLPIVSDTELKGPPIVGPYDGPLINANYKDYYIYVDPADLPYFLEERNDVKSIGAYGWYTKEAWSSTNETHPYASLQWKFFRWPMTIRGQTSVSCAKPSFKFADHGVKLKSMCGADFWLEEQVFAQSFNRQTDPAFQDIFWDENHAFYGEHKLVNVYLNDNFYW